MLFIRQGSIQHVKRPFSSVRKNHMLNKTISMFNFLYWRGNNFNIVVLYLLQLLLCKIRSRYLLDCSRNNPTFILPLIYCSMSNYNINKGIGRTVEFKGLKAQYLFIFAGGLLGVLILTMILYMANVNSYICLFIGTGGASLIVWQ